MAAPSVSVVIPTYGLGRYLNQVLVGLSRQTNMDFETIVVDNNASPVHDKSRLAHPRGFFKVVHEPRNGLNNARNAGVPNSRGDFVAFLDDDGVPDATWLAELCDGLRRHSA